MLSIIAKTGLLRSLLFILSVCRFIFQGKDAIVEVQLICEDENTATQVKYPSQCCSVIESYYLCNVFRSINIQKHHSEHKTYVIKQYPVIGLIVQYFFKENIAITVHVFPENEFRPQFQYAPYSVEIQEVRSYLFALSSRLCICLHVNV